MIIKKIKLNNIRSYKFQEVNFPEGSVLLSGDIGSGKSSILLAVDFALFGLRNPDLSGASLLRNGEKEGSVELHFNIGDKDVVITRTLKRASSSVVQDSGFIILNNEKKQATATELKQEILDLFNYPKELLTKSKSLIYRYTVYTPQEQMKSILIGDPDLRLDTLRKVFGIDKYKRINQNVQTFIRFLKEKKKELQGAISDLDPKNQEKNNFLKEQERINLSLNELEPQLQALNTKINLKKEKLISLENDISKLNELKKRIALSDLKIKNKNEQINKNNSEILDVVSQIKELSKELEPMKEIILDNLKDKILQKEVEIANTETTIRAFNSKLGEVMANQKSSQTIKEKISKLDLCPLCKQEVTSKHKNQIADKEDQKILKWQIEIRGYSKKELESTNKLNSLKKELEVLKKEQNEIEIGKLKIKNLSDKKLLHKKILESINLLKKELEQLNYDFSILNKQIKPLSSLEGDYQTAKKELDGVLEKQKQNEIRKASLGKEFSTLQRIIDSLNLEIRNKLEKKQSLNRFNRLQHWLEEYFINLMSAMEKQIMLKVHNDFSILFQNWFDILVSDELLKIKLDDQFTPLIEQNGYDIDYNYLSGGEKTAAALAYRLALNQVINKVMSTIKTKGILILDEPTDGFSEDQLDRMKLVLDNLDTSQIIIVSHENKIESFVENVIRLDKKNHVTSII